MNLQTQFKETKKKNPKKRSNSSFSVKCLLTTKCKQKALAVSSKEDEQLKEDEDIAELIELAKLIDKITKYCSKNPKDCE